MSRFDYIKMNEEQLAHVDFFRKSFAKMEQNIEAAVPEASREKSLSITALEEASLWLNKAISRRKVGE
ncbi:Uncharacterised protein [uncultured archaeon]|nr:Uncharacterised protein [uncultured archaeon]